jgi:tetratricopeptide (TPR) repeat protein
MLRKRKRVLPLTTCSKRALDFYKQGLLAEAEADRSEAMACFQKAVESDPGFVMARAQYASYLPPSEGQAVLDRAKECFEQVTEGERLFALAVDVVVRNDTVKQREILEELSVEYPDDAMVHHRLATAYFLAQDYERSIATCERAIASDHLFYGAYNLLGYACLNTGNVDGAVRWLTEYARLLPESANPWDSLGDAYRHAGDYCKAWGCYERAVEIKPDFVTALVHLGDVKHHLGYFEEAISYYQKALRALLPEKEISETSYYEGDSLHRLRVVDSYLWMGKLDQAEQELGVVLARNSVLERILGHYYGAEIALARGNIAQARQKVALVRKLEKENNLNEQEQDQIGQFLQAKIALAEGDLLAAKRFAMCAVYALGKEGRANLLGLIDPMRNHRGVCVLPLNLLAEIYRELRQAEAEIQTIEKSLELVPDQSKLHFRLGELYVLKKQRGKAVKEFETYLKFAEDFRCAQENVQYARAFLAQSVSQ